MRITPLDIQNKQFRAARMRGYNADDVDAFLDELAVEVDLATKEIENLKAQVKEAQDKIVSYDSMKDTLNSAIINAQKLADEIRVKAEEQAQSIVSEANRKASEVESEAMNRQRDLLASIDRLSQAEEDFRARFVQMLRDLESDLSARERLTPTDLVGQEKDILQAHEAAVSAQSAVFEEAPATASAEESAPAHLAPEAGEAPAPSNLEAYAASAADAVNEPEKIAFPLDEAPAVESESPVHESAVEPLMGPADETPAPVEAAAEDLSAAFSSDLASSEAASAEVETSVASPEPVAVTPTAPATRFPEVEAPLSEAAEEPMFSLREEIEAAPAEEATAPPAPGFSEAGSPKAVDDSGASDEIAAAVERMRKMLGEAGVEAKSAESEGAGADLFQGGEATGSGSFSDLGEGVPGVRKRRGDQNPDDLGSEVD